MTLKWIFIFRHENFETDLEESNFKNQYVIEYSLLIDVRNFNKDKIFEIAKTAKSKNIMHRLLNARNLFNFVEWYFKNRICDLKVMQW